MEYEPLTTQLTKKLSCGHERTDCSAMKIGRSAHCWQCRGLADVVDVFFPAKVKPHKHDIERLKAAGYTEREITRMATAPGGAR